MNQESVEVYKRLICDMIQSMTDERFIRQIYSIVYGRFRGNEVRE